MVSVLCLGNEFLDVDSLAKKVGEKLKGFVGVVMVNDSFQLMTLLSGGDNVIILDVVKGLREVRVVSVDELKHTSMLSAHDFDASYVIKLVGKPVRIIGIPIVGDVDEITNKVKGLLL